jgi:hypothetical protein
VHKLHASELLPSTLLYFLRLHNFCISSTIQYNKRTRCVTVNTTLNITIRLLLNTVHSYTAPILFLCQRRYWIGVATSEKNNIGMVAGRRCAPMHDALLKTVCPLLLTSHRYVLWHTWFAPLNLRLVREKKICRCHIGCVRRMSEGGFGC